MRILCFSFGIVFFFLVSLYFHYFTITKVLKNESLNLLFFKYNCIVNERMPCSNITNHTYLKVTLSTKLNIIPYIPFKHIITYKKYSLINMRGKAYNSNIFFQITGRIKIVHFKLNKLYLMTDVLRRVRL